VQQPAAVLIGVPKEIKTREYRVGMTPAGVRSLVAHGHKVIVEKNAGEGSGISDDKFVRAGATIVDTAADAWSADMVVKVKEPLKQEYGFFRKDLILYTYLHLAAEPELTRELAAKVRRRRRLRDHRAATTARCPLLKPMSEVAGRMSSRSARRASRRSTAARACSSAACPARAAVAWSSSAAASWARNAAATIAIGMGAQVTRARRERADVMAYLEDVFGARSRRSTPTPKNIEQAGDARRSRHRRGARGRREGAQARGRASLSKMEQGSVVVDVAVDQGGCIETCRPTTHDNPRTRSTAWCTTACANMPGAVAHTSTSRSPTSPRATRASASRTRSSRPRWAERSLSAPVEEPAAPGRGLFAFRGEARSSPSSSPGRAGEER
jgi:alanine dehydrogenase